MKTVYGPIFPIIGEDLAGESSETAIVPERREKEKCRRRNEREAPQLRKELGVFLEFYLLKKLFKPVPSFSIISKLPDFSTFKVQSTFFYTFIYIFQYMEKYEKNTTMTGFQSLIHLFFGQIYKTLPVV